MKNLAYALRRDENASQSNLLRWMICGSTPSDISDACIGAVNSLMCVSFIMRRLQPLLGEKDSKDQSYTAYFRPDKRELNELYREIEYARDFNIDNNTGYPIIQTVFGPCLAEGKNATYWECLLRCLTSSLLHFEEKTSAEKIILSYVGKGNASWLQLYAFLCAQTGCLITGRLPGAKAINALIQAEKNPDNAPGQLIRIIKRQKRSPIGEATIRDMMIHKKSFLVLDWPLRAVNSKGSTKTFQMMVNEQGWTNIEERSYYGSSEQVSSPNDTLNIISRLQKLDKLIAERRRRDMDDSPMSVHIWMSLYDWVCMRGCGWQVTANPIIDSLQKAISDLVNTCKGLVVVCVNRDVAFHGGRGDLGTIANKVSEICKAAGALVTENDRLWRVVHALTGKPGSSNLQYFLLKRLLIEKSIDAVAPSNAFVCELEGTCINEPDLRPPRQGGRQRAGLPALHGGRVGHAAGGRHQNSKCPAGSRDRGLRRSAAC